MKTFCVLGTCVGADAIRLSRRPEWKVGKTFISYSLAAIVDSYEKSRKAIKKNPFHETKYDNECLLAELNGSLLLKIKEESFDLLLVDICDFRLTEKVFELENGEKIYCTNRNYTEETNSSVDRLIEKEYGSKIKKKSLRTYRDVSCEEIAEKVKKLADILYKEIGREKVLFFCSVPIMQYIEGNEIKRVDNYASNGRTVRLMKEVFRLLDRSNIDIAPCPEKLIGDPSCISLFEFHFCRPYYKYLCEAIDLKLRGARSSYEIEVAELLKECENGINRLYGRIGCEALINKVKPIVSAREPKLVVVAKTEQLCEMIKAKLGIETSYYIEYNEESILEELKEQIDRLWNDDKNTVFLFPELFMSAPHTGVQRMMYDLSCVEHRDYIIFSPSPFALPAFRGYYEDVYNSVVHSESTLNIVLNGGASYVDIDTDRMQRTKIHIGRESFLQLKKESVGHDGVINVGNCAAMVVGERSSFADSHIACHSLTKLTMGKDILFSWKEMVFSGDGHSIFSILDEQKNAKRVNLNENDEIVIGDHVWVGYRCHILAGANIGSGSIVGAGSLVNKKFPNNVILAGVPAKVIKRNVAWSENPFYKDIRLDKRVFELYTNLTCEEEKNEN